jgi:hypothetical protein
MAESMAPIFAIVDAGCVVDVVVVKSVADMDVLLFDWSGNTINVLVVVPLAFFVDEVDCG